MGSHGFLFSFVELVGTPLVLFVLVRSIRRRRRVTAAVCAVLVFGLVFANPLGVVANASTADPRPTTPTATADDAAHWLKVGGVPVAWFGVYAQDLVGPEGDGGPTKALKVRYGFPFLLTSAASTVHGACGEEEPCTVLGHALVRTDGRGRPWIEALRSEGDVTYSAHFYPVRLGLASKEALVYWTVAILLIVLASTRVRIRWRFVTLSVTATVVGGIVLTALVAHAPAARVVDPRLDVPDVIGVSEPTHRVAGAVSARKLGDAPPAEPWEVAATGTVAVWTAADGAGTVGLRARPLTGSAAHALPAAWRARSCALPRNLQATAIAGGRALVAWSDGCDAAIATIHGLVVDHAGGAVGEPFEVARLSANPGVSPGVWFGLAATAAGRPVIAFGEAATYERPDTALFVSLLDARNQATETHELDGRGLAAIACGHTCAVARSDRGELTVSFLDAHGTVSSTQSLGQGPASFVSAPVLAAHGLEFAAGWLLSPGSLGPYATAKIARFRPGGEPSVASVWRDLPLGGGIGQGAPPAIGIQYVGEQPVLAWEAGAPEHRLYVASTTAATAWRHAPLVFEAELTPSAVVATSQDGLVALPISP